jgi:hypothetical protein
MAGDARASLCRPAPPQVQVEVAGTPHRRAPVPPLAAHFFPVPVARFFLGASRPLLPRRRPPASFPAPSAQEHILLRVAKFLGRLAARGRGRVSGRDSGDFRRAPTMGRPLWSRSSRTSYRLPPLPWSLSVFVLLRRRGRSHMCCPGDYFGQGTADDLILSEILHWAKRVGAGREPPGCSPTSCRVVSCQDRAIVVTATKSSALGGVAGHAHIRNPDLQSWASLIGNRGGPGRSGPRGWRGGRNGAARNSSGDLLPVGNFSLFYLSGEGIRQDLCVEKKEYGAF